jgi:lipid-A-disaccharide synthase
MVSARMRHLGFGGRIYGLCGAEGVSAGIDAAWRNEILHLMGISEVFRSLGGVMRLMGEMRRNILEASPDVMVVADSPDFHLPLIRHVRRHGYRGKIFYISPPSVWAWRKYRVRDLASRVDVCFPLFQFEHEYLERAGCCTKWAGHPLVEEFADASIDRGRVLGGITGGAARPGGSVAALLPGSRRSEIERLYPVLSGLYEALESRMDCPVFSVAPGLSGGARDFLVKSLETANQRYYEGPGRDIMGASDVVAGSSGTATAEALLLRRYMVVMYKVSPLSHIVGRALLRGVKFAIPNLLAGEYFYPELLQGEATPERAFGEVCRWLDMDEAARGGARRKMDALAGLMGSPGAYDFWAGEILGVF